MAVGTLKVGELSDSKCWICCPRFAYEQPRQNENGQQHWPFFFFFNDTAPTDIYTLSLHDALPIFTPVQFDPTDPQVMYYGSNELNRSTNAAQTWTVISPDLTGGPGRDPNYPFGTITTVAASATQAQELFTGTDDGRLWYTRNLGADWTRAT